MAFATYGAAGPIEAIRQGPYWSTWPDNYQRNLAHLITAPTSEGGSVGGLGHIGNNLAKMVKRIENMTREAARNSSRRQNLQL